MKKTLLLTGLLITGAAAMAQRTFTVESDEGVMMMFNITSEREEQTVKLVANDYSGRVIVPQTVRYNDTIWTVTSVGTAFSRRPVTYVSLPATVTALEAESFLFCNNLDTMVFASTEVMDMPRTGSTVKLYRVFNTREYYRMNMVILVPCGSLASYRKTQWGNYLRLQSDCSIPIVVKSWEDGVVRVDSIKGLTSDNFKLHNSSGWYEVGDTAFLRYEWLIGDGYQWGWSCGTDELVVTEADTVYCNTFSIDYAMLNQCNNISTPVSTIGSLSNRNMEANYCVIPGSNSSTIFSSALWVGGYAGFNHVAVHKYWSNGTDFAPGPLRIDDGTNTPGCSFETRLKFNHVWHITREMIDYHVAHCGEAGYVPNEEIMTWPGNGDSVDGFAAQLAPYYDADGDGRYIALAGDYPIIRGDEAVFSVFNDFADHTASNGNPMYLEIHCMTYAFKEPQDTILSNTIFQHYDIYNRSNCTYTDCYLGSFVDFDIGYSNNDYIGCDVENNMFYGYNASVTDANFEGDIPAQGCLILDRGDNPGMTSFVAYNNQTSTFNGEPMNVTQYYNYMQGKWGDGTPLTYGGYGYGGEQNYPYMYPAGSDPTVDYWDELVLGISPGDRRGVGGSGPYLLEGGASLQFDIAHLSSWPDESDCVGCARSSLKRHAQNLRQQWLRDTTDSGKPFVHTPYSAPHIVGIDDANITAQVRLYPNPTTGIVHIVHPLSDEQKIDVVDMMGRIVYSIDKTGTETTIDLSALPCGIYFLRFGNIAKRLIVRKSNL